MPDVRLTATNPEDSSVVPVACNERGELKLEEPLVVEGPPGDKGDKGDPGDPFSGNFADDVTFGGNAQVNGQLQVLSKSIQFLQRNDGSAFYLKNADGEVEFSIVETGNTTINGFLGVYGRNPNGASFASSGHIFIGNNDSGRYPIELNVDGSARFSGNKAGFTAEGHLWCTTRRGDTVILDVTSNGLASWVPYTPPNRLTELQDKWAEKDGILPVPHESSQDEPETTQ